MCGLEHEQEGSDSAPVHPFVLRCLWGLLGPGLPGDRKIDKPAVSPGRQSHRQGISTRCDRWLERVPWVIKARVTGSAVLLFLRFWTSFSLFCSSGASLTTKAGHISRYPLLVQGSCQGGFQLHGISTLEGALEASTPVLLGYSQ